MVTVRHEQRDAFHAGASRAPGANDDVIALDEATVRRALAEVPDPELPVVSIVDLGMVGRVEASPDRVRVEILPTFVGCPAIELMQEAVRARLAALAPDLDVVVAPTRTEPWTSDRITPAGRERLRAAGIAPPHEVAAPAAAGTRALPVIELDAPVACPSCGSTGTRLENPFGPTPCRTIRYCPDCRQPFEQLKTI